MNFLFESITAIISKYNGEVPLAGYLKKYFKEHPKLGSRDRRSITEAVYIYYRCVAFYQPKQDILNTIYQGINIIGSENKYLKDSFERIKEKLLPVQEFKIQNWPYFNTGNISLSDGIALEEWLNNLCKQPDLFIRIRIKKEQAIEKLNAAHFDFQEIKIADGFENAIALKNAIKLDSVFKPNEFVVQDWASQSSIATVMSFVENQLDSSSKLTLWDVCAGAGGKSIFWKEKRASDFLLTTDIRPSAIKNLRERFATYNIQHFQATTADVIHTDELNKKLKKQAFDVVVCDVPCSGSGTWARTPEDFYFFKAESLKEFAQRQYALAFEAQKHLKKSGVFAYITCSVFKEENEQVVNKLLATTSLKLHSQTLINGTMHNADAMFVALFQF